MKPHPIRSIGVGLAFLFIVVIGRSAHGADPAKADPPAKAPSTANEPAGPEEADIKKIREKYWTRGDDAEVGVVQNRMFTKRRKMEFGLDFDTVYGDPFLSTR